MEEEGVDGVDGDGIEEVEDGGGCGDLVVSAVVVGVAMDVLGGCPH